MVAACSSVGLQRKVRLAHVAIGVSFLLVRAAVLRCQGLEALELLEREVEVAIVAVANGAHVKRVSVVRIGIQRSRQFIQRIVESFRNDLVLDGRNVKNRSIYVCEIIHP